jgi:hypothetical protein
MIQFFIILVAVLAGISPALWEWRTAQRARRLSFHKLQISQSVLEMGELMLKGELKMGQACHDQVFIVMQRVQEVGVYPVLWLPQKETPDTLAFKSRLESELHDENSPALPHIHNFLKAYYGAFEASRPIVSKIYLIYLTVLYLCARTALFSIKAIIKFMAEKERRHLVLGEALVVKTYANIAAA